MALSPSIIALLAVLLLQLQAPLPAQSYYYGYPYGGYGRNLLYSIPYLAAPLLGFGSPYSANPLFSATSYLNRSTRRLFTYPYAGYYGVSGRPYVTQQYQDDEPLYYPRERIRPVRPGNIGVDEITHAQWRVHSQSAGSTGIPESDPFADPVASEEFPPVAPPIASKRAPGPPPVTGSGAPLAVGFLNLVDTKFDGDIHQALFDPQARSWARSLGLIDEDQLFSQTFEPTRTHLIQQVIRDKTLDPVSKLNAIKILLPPGSANRAK
ncbi:MAG: hypothetical protein IPM23_04165 [Candidatus Melainabacteria bacterium]|nr:hypothetical protein [Candidatus Melainabacteria bacterium]